jgi:hypothetical protein
MVLLCGDDLYHPAPISEEIARLNPGIEVIKSWKAPEAAGRGQTCPRISQAASVIIEVIAVAHDHPVGKRQESSGFNQTDEC